MDTMKLCPKCASPLPKDAPSGICPKCLLNAGFESQSGAAANPMTGFVPPEPAELAKHFPQLEIIEMLGAGGMGVVYKARQVALDRIVAVKILPPGAGSDPAFAERFAREARALAKLSHPNIVGVYDFGQAGPYYYFLMEFIDGVNLRQMITAQRIEPREALAIVPQICDALQYAHDLGIVHRDIKPENLLIDRRGRVRIADFGLARLLGPLTDPRLTQTQHVMGTPHYMAPEQFEKPLAVDHRADIYSLGVVLYEMLTGELPLGRFDLPSHKVQVDVRLDDIVLKTLEREPARRYQHASEVKTEMEMLGGIPFSKLPPGLRNMMGVEYKSKATLFGWPLLHVSMGYDPATGQQRHARGIIAIGGRATGLFAFGGFARGLFAFGGVAVGLVAVGGVAVGVVGMGGVVLAMLLAWGGLAFALGIAFGGIAVGYYACGGFGIGAHAMSSSGMSPAKSLLVARIPHARRGRSQPGAAKETPKTPVSSFMAPSWATCGSFPVCVAVPSSSMESMRGFGFPIRPRCTSRRRSRSRCGSSVMAMRVSADVAAGRTAFGRGENVSRRPLGEARRVSGKSRQHTERRTDFQRHGSRSEGRIHVPRRDRRSGPL